MNGAKLNASIAGCRALERLSARTETGEVHINSSKARLTLWRFWPRFCSSETNFENPKDSYNPRLKSVDFDRWFDMFTDSRLMAVAIKFHLRRKFWQCQKIWRTVLQCDYPYDECQTVSVFQDKLWAELMLENILICHKLRRSRPPLTEFIWYVADNWFAPLLFFMWVCRAAYTILLKYAGIAAIHILFIMIANSSVPRAMQFVVTGRVRTSFLRAPVFNSSWLSYSLTLVTTEIPQCDMIIMFVQSDKYNPKGLLKNRTVWARLKLREEHIGIWKICGVFL